MVGFGGDKIDVSNENPYPYKNLREFQERFLETQEMLKEVKSTDKIKNSLILLTHCGPTLSDLENSKLKTNEKCKDVL